MAILPTRTSADVNAAGDINTLSTEALDKGGTSQLAALTAEGTPATGDLFLLEDAATGALKKVAKDNMPYKYPDFIIDMPAGSFDYPSSNYAPWEKKTGTNGDIFVNMFDDTTEEFVIGQFKLPPTYDANSNVTFYIEGYSATAASSKNVQFKFYYSIKVDGNDWDASFDNESSGDLAVDSTQDNLDFFSWTVSAGDMSLEQGGHVRFKLSRIAPLSNNLSGDYYLTHFRIRIPR